jgi:hypothetical protein
MQQQKQCGNGQPDNGFRQPTTVRIYHLRSADRSVTRRTGTPGGYALKSKYQPVNMVSMVEMQQAMSAVSMKKDEDPSSLFEQIRGIDNRFQRAAISMTEEEKIDTILMAAPREYALVNELHTFNIGAA